MHALRKCGTMQALGEAVEDILEAGVPIRCQAGVAVAAHLANMPPAVLRLPLSFKTRATGAVHRHIVLAIRGPSRRWGSMGISRCARLIDKPMDYSSLSALVRELERSYDVCGHELRTIYLGLPFSTSRACRLPIVCRALHVAVMNEGTTIDSDSEGPLEGDSGDIGHRWTHVVDHFKGSLSTLISHHVGTMRLGLRSGIVAGHAAGQGRSFAHARPHHARDSSTPTATANQGGTKRETRAPRRVKDEKANKQK